MRLAAVDSRSDFFEVTSPDMWLPKLGEDLLIPKQIRSHDRPRPYLAI